MVRPETAQQSGFRLCLERHPNRTPPDRTSRDQGVVNLASGVRGNGEPHSIVTPAPGGDGGINANHLPGKANQRATAVARIDGGIGLQKAFKLALSSPFNVAALSADDPCGYRGFKSEGASN